MNLKTVRFKLKIFALAILPINTQAKCDKNSMVNNFVNVNIDLFWDDSYMFVIWLFKKILYQIEEKVYLND